MLLLLLCPLWAQQNHVRDNQDRLVGVQSFSVKTSTPGQEIRIWDTEERTPRCGFVVREGWVLTISTVPDPGTIRYRAFGKIAEVRAYSPETHLILLSAPGVGPGLTPIKVGVDMLEKGNDITVLTWSPGIPPVRTGKVVGTGPIFAEIQMQGAGGGAVGAIFSTLDSDLLLGLHVGGTTAAQKTGLVVSGQQIVNFLEKSAPSLSILVVRKH